MNPTLKFLLIFSAVFIVACSGTAVQVDKQHEYQTAILKEYFKLPGCGIIAFAGAFAFTLEKDSSIFEGIVRCPDIYGDSFFKEGEKYRVKLSDKNIEDSLKIYSLWPQDYKKNGVPIMLITKIGKG